MVFLNVSAQYPELVDAGRARREWANSPEGQAASKQLEAMNKDTRRKQHPSQHMQKTSSRNKKQWREPRESVHQIQVMPAHAALEKEEETATSGDLKKKKGGGGANIVRLEVLATRRLSLKDQFLELKLPGYGRLWSLEKDQSRGEKVSPTSTKGNKILPAEGCRATRSKEQLIEVAASPGTADLGKCCIIC